MPKFNTICSSYRYGIFAGVFIARGKEDALVTKNLVPGESVYGEKRISVEVRLKVELSPLTAVVLCVIGWGWRHRGKNWVSCVESFSQQISSSYSWRCGEDSHSARIQSALPWGSLWDHSVTCCRYCGTSEWKSLLYCMTVGSLVDLFVGGFGVCRGVFPSFWSWPNQCG